MTGPSKTDPCVTNDAQAYAYKMNSITWSLIYTLSWSNIELLKMLRQAEEERKGTKDAVNTVIKVVVEVLRGQGGAQVCVYGHPPAPEPDAKKCEHGHAVFDLSDIRGKYGGLPDPTFPEGVNLRINEDTTTLATLIIPPVQRIPRDPLQMVPYSL